MNYFTKIELEELLDKIQCEDILHDFGISKKKLKSYFDETARLLHKIWKEEANLVIGTKIYDEFKEQREIILKLRKENEELKKAIRMLRTYKKIKKEYRACEDKYLKKIEESYRDFYDSNQY